MTNLYHLLPAPKESDDLGIWRGHVSGFDEVIGYSSLGHAFLRKSETSEYAVLHPLRYAMKNYGVFDDVASFEATILMDEDFSEFVLRPHHVEALEAKLGSLGAERVYIPCPYPFLGGDDSVESYQEGNYWVFLDLVGQSLGLE